MHTIISFIDKVLVAEIAKFSLFCSINSFYSFTVKDVQVPVSLEKVRKKSPETDKTVGNLTQNDRNFTIEQKDSSMVENKSMFHHNI